MRSLRPLRSPIVAQFVKYGVVGIVNTLLSVALIVLGDRLGVWHIAAYAVAYGVGAINGYVVNRRWTFQASAPHSRLAVRYFVVQGAALLASTGLVYLLVDVAGMQHVLGQLIAIATAVTGGFFANRWWTFAQEEPPAGDSGGPEVRAPAPASTAAR
ncbi:MAG TPA: GtrA family protein [Solirubrobacteraceae bacterium]|jgi:putative flippase GtrA|nr:GtrA family protein [Solirubrobacteraceae bacterium]